MEDYMAQNERDMSLAFNFVHVGFFASSFMEKRKNQLVTPSIALRCAIRTAFSGALIYPR
jgi:hypothetical protein